MPKTYEQEILEIESARISADLAYHREREILKNKPMFSKREMDQILYRLPWYFLGGGISGLLLGFALGYAKYHS